jgi:hypothetical protein
MQEVFLKKEKYFSGAKERGWAWEKTGLGSLTRGRNCGTIILLWKK